MAMTIDRRRFVQGTAVIAVAAHHPALWAADTLKIG